MIKSMTGFGRGKYENEGRNYVVDIKSVNHKYTDISVRLPRFFSTAENDIRKKVTEYISRGKIDVQVSYENYGSKGISVRINRELAKKYLEEMDKLSLETGLKNPLTALDVSKFPEILKIEDEEEDSLLTNELMIAVEDALKNFIAMREIEGTKLVQDIEKRVENIKNNVKEITKHSHTVVDEYIGKLKSKLEEYIDPSTIDQNRVMQEIVIYSDKVSIEEELTRLNSHINQLLSLLKEDSPIGKKIDFLIQEMNRETNTIGSKANNLTITKNVIDIKTEIENIREQIQNIE